MGTWSVESPTQRRADCVSRYCNGKMRGYAKSTGQIHRRREVTRRPRTVIRRLPLLLITLTAGLVTGCRTPYHRPVLTPVDAVFSGIADAYKSSDGAAVPEVDVFLVHGMGYHDSSWITGMIQPLATELGFLWDGKLPKPDTVASGGQLFRVTLSDGMRRLNFATVLWSPITLDAKKKLCYDVNSPTITCPNKAAFTPYKRAWANGYIKSQIMDDRLSDVTYYLGGAGGRRIRDAVDDGMLRSLSAESLTLEQAKAGGTPTSRGVPLFIVTESLGSKIAIDSLNDIEQITGSQDFASETRSHVRALFLLANQIPILNLGSRDEVGNPDIYQHLKTFATARSQRRQSGGLSATPLQIVGFSDPSDVFSYVLSSDAVPHEDAIVTNVIVSNDCTYAGVFENPANAHEKYIQNNPVANAIAHGSGALRNANGVKCAK